jgi:hypothetical protein
MPGTVATDCSRFARSMMALLLLIAGAGCNESPGESDLGGHRAVDVMRLGHARVELETRALFFGVGERAHLVRGWSIDEWDKGRRSFFVWATAPEAVVAFDVLRVEDKQMLVALRPFAGGGVQRITLSVNGSTIGEFAPRPDFWEYRFVVPAAALRRGRNELSFRHAVLGRGKTVLDQRRLGAAYSTILMAPACTTLRGRGVAPRPRVVVRRGSQGRRPLLVIGPAEITRRLRVPPAASFHWEVALPGDTRDTARFTVELRSRGEWRELARVRLSPAFFRAHRRSGTVDLGPWTGRRVELRLSVMPEPCASSVASLNVERAAVIVPRDTAPVAVFDAGTVDR